MKHPSDQGAAAVEFALVLPLLLLVLFGIIDFGRAYNAQQALNAGTREGARVKALGTGDAVAATRTAAYPLTPSSVNVSSTVCSAGNDSHATVSSTYSFSYITPISSFMVLFGGSGLASPLTLNAKATFRCT